MSKRTIDPGAPRRALSRTEAATYIGISPTMFDTLVFDGRMPLPRRINTRRLWDMKALDKFFERLPGGGEASDNEWDR